LGWALGLGLPVAAPRGASAKLGSSLLEKTWGAEETAAAAEASEVAYSSFLDLVDAGKVDVVRFSSSGKSVLAELSEPTELQRSPGRAGGKDGAGGESDKEEVTKVKCLLPPPGDAALLPLLRKAGVLILASQEPASKLEAGIEVYQTVIEPAIFLGLLFVLMSQLGGGKGGPFGIGKSKAKMYKEGDTGVTFSDVAGCDEAKGELVEVVDFLKNPGKYAKIGGRVPRGVLLSGPAGTGKTLLAKAVAGEAGVPFYSVSGSEFVELFVGLGAARVRDLFEEARKSAPCIIFVDELDAIGGRRGGASPAGGGSNEEREQTLNQLLTEMDGFQSAAESSRTVMVLAATNRPDVLDPALKRPGRFDRQVVVGRPDRRGREAILKLNARLIEVSADVDLSVIAARTTGFSGAELANLVNEAALLAARASKTAADYKCFQEALERVVAGIERPSFVVSPGEKRIVAFHEAGHAIVGEIARGDGLDGLHGSSSSVRTQKISIVPRGGSALGYALRMPEEDKFLMAEEDIRSFIAMALGGRAAEALVFGRLTSGAADDLQKATQSAESMVCRYGMCREMGPRAIEEEQGENYLGGSGPGRRAISNDTLELTDRSIANILSSGERAASEILKANRDVLDLLAATVLDEEVVEGAALDTILSAVKVPPAAKTWLHTGVYTADPDVN